MSLLNLPLVYGEIYRTRGGIKICLEPIEDKSNIFYQEGYRFQSTDGRVYFETGLAYGSDGTSPDDLVQTLRSEGNILDRQADLLLKPENADLLEKALNRVNAPTSDPARSVNIRASTYLIRPSNRRVLYITDGTDKAIRVGYLENDDDGYSCVEKRTKDSNGWSRPEYCDVYNVLSEVIEFFGEHLLLKEVGVESGEPFFQ